MWDAEGDLTRRKLVDMYHEIKGTRLPWDSYKVAIYSPDVIDEIKKLCEEFEIEFEMIAKLIIEIEATKNYTKGSTVAKAFDKILNQGWLHHGNIQKGLADEN